MPSQFGLANRSRQSLCQAAEIGLPESRLLTHFGGRVKVMLALNVGEAAQPKSG
jgi:hypothetical protein